MTEETLEQRIQYISFLHKQNLNGRETEDELFEAGILAGIEETKERMYSEEDMEEAFTNGLNRSFDSDFDRWFEQFKKK